ncbi:MAG TPA: hypothetical protein PK605_00315 [Ignavibacteria bacterium]|nr:hypothetical protein [Bacteroidota bacterium]HRF65981.1 hypothetical protein [Ignavibacteria bacterium]HRJ02822.1 hypothetical protein [Ignavibacteria bacterium]HRJ84380.1 hypothetical protein [Ignavibacteria bacterium]
MINDIQNLPVKEQKKAIDNFFVQVTRQIADLDVSIEAGEAEVKEISAAIRKSTLNQKKLAKKKQLDQQKKLKAEIKSRYTGALQFAQQFKLIDAEPKQIGE